MSTVSMEEFLKPFSEALGRTDVPADIEGIDVENSVQFIVAKATSPEQVVQTFVTEAEKIGVLVKACAPGEVAQAVIEEVRRLDPANKTVLYANEDEAASCGLAEALAEAGLEAIAWDASHGRDAIHEASSLDVGVTFAYGAIAETGSVVQCSSEGTGRSIYTIPPCHVAVVRRSKVFARMGQLLDDLRDSYGAQSMPSNISVISGPSATADIELVRVVGVHGPVHTAVVMIED
ncbi:MAG: LUD domain-containing protein [Coriobacteriia bacterium]|nr:LUD domain-containing protein [Coriobacteriia bacterium]